MVGKCDIANGLTKPCIDCIAEELHAARNTDADMADWARRYGLKLLEAARMLHSVQPLEGHEDQPIEGGYRGESPPYNRDDEEIKPPAVDWPPPGAHPIE